MRDTCDVLVVGGGGAALRAAIAAYEREPALDVVLVTKGELGHSGVTATACSDRMAFHATLPSTEPGGPDAWRFHADDIYRIGGFVSDADLAVVLARESATAFDYLDRLGVPWVRRADGRVDQFVTDGSLYVRACYTGPYTANHIEAALLRRLRELPIRVIDDALVAELLLDARHTRVTGAALTSQRDGQVAALGARAIVLATGGAGQVFAVNVYPPDCTGDGYALAYRAGAELVNLEFIQIGLCSLATKLACSGDMMRALPRLVNDRGEEFLRRYLPAGTSHTEMYSLLFAKGASWPVSSREPTQVIDIAVARELASGRRVFLDYTRDPQGLVPSNLSDRARSWYTQTKGLLLSGDPRMMSPLSRLKAINPVAVEWLAARKVHLAAGDTVEVAPAVQHFQGGVKIRTHGETTIPGLYAAGEVAGGQHGANRPGGNALLDTQVFGRIAGESAAAYALTQDKGSVPSLKEAVRAVDMLLSPSGCDAESVRERVGRAMSRDCGVVRLEAGLRDLLGELDEIAQSGVGAQGVPLGHALESANILQVARLLARAALERGESRGPHLRFDTLGASKPLAQDDAHWTQYIVIRAGRDGPIIERREPVRPD
jgi:succinate dehydrogenase / fumarate reductase flavoprotein subunit